MTILQACVLAVVQGIAEFLPISSSGFLILVPQFFRWDVQSLAFDTFLHLATLLAILVTLRAEVFWLMRGLVSRQKNDPYRVLAWSIVIATLPALLVGFVFADFIESTLRSPLVVGYSFVVWGSVLWVSDRWAKRNTIQVLQVGYRRVLLMGLAQCIALIPGTSRSGITMTAGLWSGLTRETTARVSFLLAIPVTAAAGIYQLPSLIHDPFMPSATVLGVGFFVTFLVAVATITFLLAFLRRFSFVPLAIFRVGLGVMLIFIFS